MRRSPWATCCAMVLLATAVAGARAQTEEAGPPERALPGASFTVVDLSFATASVSFSTAELSLGSSPVTAGEGVVLGLGAATSDLPGLSVREEGGGLRFTLGADVLFDFDRYDLRPEAGPILRKLVEQVEAQVPRARWQVEGHTDAKGSDAYNDRLSNRRAASVRRWLTREGGVPATDIATIGFGERRPVAPNEHPDGSDDPEGRQKNRRVEILVTPRP